jgi:nicotinamidase-related amidase
MKPAIMIIDMQKAFYVDETTKKTMDNACEYINVLVEQFRAKTLPIVWVQHINENDNLVEGQDGFNIIEKLCPAATEPRIFKKYGNSFNKTECQKILASNSIDTVFLSGFCAEGCVLATYAGAKNFDLTPVIVRSTLASGSIENMKFVENICELISIKALIKILENV